jgi:hypothetical protein
MKYQIIHKATGAGLDEDSLVLVSSSCRQFEYNILKGRCLGGWPMNCGYGSIEIGGRWWNGRRHSRKVDNKVPNLSPEGINCNKAQSVCAILLKG